MVVFRAIGGLRYIRFVTPGGVGGERSLRRLPLFLFQEGGTLHDVYSYFFLLLLFSGVVVKRERDSVPYLTQMFPLPSFFFQIPKRAGRLQLSTQREEVLLLIPIRKTVYFNFYFSLATLHQKKKKTKCDTDPLFFAKSQPPCLVATYVLVPFLIRRFLAYLLIDIGRPICNNNAEDEGGKGEDADVKSHWVFFPFF